MQRALLLSVFSLFIGAGQSWGVAPLEADGLRSVLIRGRVIAPVIPPPPALEGEVSLPAPVAQSLPLPGVAGPEPTPAAPRLEAPPTGGRPVANPPATPSLLRGAKTRVDAGANRLAGSGGSELEKSRDADPENRPRGGLFRRRR